MRDEMWYESRNERHRIVAIEYSSTGWPHGVVTEEHWDHSGKPWFNPAKDKPRGTVAAHWDFDFSKTYGELFHHQSGFGGDPLRHVVNGKPIGWVARLWIADDVRLYRQVRRRGKLVAVPAEREQIEKIGYRFLKRPRLLRHSEVTTRNPFQVSPSFDDYSCVYCPKCKDELPDGLNYNLCEHLTYCECCCDYYLEGTRELVQNDGSCEHKEMADAT